MAEISAFGLNINTDNISNAQKMIFGGVIALLILGGGIYQFTYPVYEEYQELVDQIEQKTQIRDKKRLQVAKLPALRKELKALRARLALIRKQIPVKDNIPSLLIDVEEMTESSLHGNEAVLKTFIPKKLEKVKWPPSLKKAAKSPAAKRLRQLPVDISLSKTTYPEFITLMADYESYERTLSFGSLSVIPTKPESDSPFDSVNVRFTLKTFMLGQAGAPKKGKRKGK